MSQAENEKLQKTVLNQAEENQRMKTVMEQQAKVTEPFSLSHG